MKTIQKFKEPKKVLILYILKMLENCSDAEHPLTQIKICDEIRNNFLCDRKTVGRNIKSLIDLGYPIVKTKQGFYLDHRGFTLDEIEQVVALIQNADLAARVRETLAAKLKQKEIK